MRYAFSRKINLSRFFPEMKYETVDFHIEDCDSMQEAVDIIKTEIETYLKQTKEEYEALKSQKVANIKDRITSVVKKDSFIESLEETAGSQPTIESPLMVISDQQISNFPQKKLPTKKVIKL